MSIFARKNKSFTSYSAECNFYSKYSKYGMCCTHRIDYQVLEDALLHVLKEAGEAFLSEYDDEALISKAVMIQQKELIQNQQELHKLESEKEKNQKIIANLYDDRLNEIISARQYVMMSKRYDDILDALEKKEEAVKAKIKAFPAVDKQKEINEIRILLKQFVIFEKPTHELMFQLVDKIEVDKDRNIEVYFKSDISKYIGMVRKKGEIVS